MREKLLLRLARVHYQHPWRMVGLCAILTVVFAIASEHMTFTMRWSDLLPEKDPRTVQYNHIIDEFKTSTSVIVVVQGDETQMKQFADELAPQVLNLRDTTKNAQLAEQIESLQNQLNSENQQAERKEIEKEIATLKSDINKKLFQRVDYKRETEFLKSHGLMLIKEKDLDDSKDVFTDPNLPKLLTNINNSMEKEYVGRQESISTREKQDNAVMFLDGLEGLVDLFQTTVKSDQIPDPRPAIDAFLTGDPYFLSYDKSALLMNIIPNFTMTEMDYVIVGTQQIKNKVVTLLETYPDLDAGLTGMIPLGHDEWVYSQQSLGYTTIIALVAILAMLIITLRLWLAPIYAIGNLLIGIIWAIGAAALLVGQLNIMTQMMMVILLGLGIDFSIHLISFFTERRAAGDSIADSVESMFIHSGKGVLTGGLTTSFAFLTMIVSSSRGMKEMGIVTGIGLLAILLATFLLLPAVMVLREKRLERKKKGGSSQKANQDISFRFLGKLGVLLSKKYATTFVLAVLLTVVFAWQGSRITFDHNYMNIEPKGLESIALQDTVLEKFDMSMDYALLVTDSPGKARQRADQFRDKSTVAMTEDISMYLPSEEQQNVRANLIRDIRSAMSNARTNSGLSAVEFNSIIRELDRLQMNVIEMQDMAFLGGQDKVERKCAALVGTPDNPDSAKKIQALLETLKGKHAKSRLQTLQSQFAPYYKDSVLKMATTEPIQLTDLPESILERYSNQNHSKFLVTIFPSGNVWKDANFLQQFVDDLEAVSENTTGMPPIFLALIQVIGKDGRTALFLTLIIVFCLLWLDFGKPRYALFAMLPLFLGIIWMVGLMRLTGMQFTVMNVMGLPMILGIGIDDGVHVVHRWLNEGRNHIYTVFSSTGKAILLTSLTTMLAFGSLMFSIWRGFAQLGGALFVGVAACFLATVLLLPGIFGLIRHRSLKKDQA